MRAGCKFQEDLLKLRDEAEESRIRAASVIACIDNMLNTYSTDDIIAYLRNRGCSYSQIGDRTGLSVSGVMGKVKKLEQQGLITYNPKDK